LVYLLGQHQMKRWMICLQLLRVPHKACLAMNWYHLDLYCRRLPGPVLHLAHLAHYHQQGMAYQDHNNYRALSGRPEQLLSRAAS
jgi:hypothetical protein